MKEASVAHKSMVDDQLVGRISVDDEKAFRLLYDRYFTFLCTTAMYYVLDADLAKEVVNDVFVNVWQRRSGLEYPVLGYLQRSVRNGCLNYIRSRKARALMEEGYMSETLRLQEIQLLRQPTPFDICEFRELEQLVRRQVASLPEKCRTIFEQYLYFGRSPKEIAAEMGLSVNTVRVQVKIALDRLKDSLHPYVGLMVFILQQRLN